MKLKKESINVLRNIAIDYKGTDSLIVKKIIYNILNCEKENIEDVDIKDLLYNIDSLDDSLDFNLNNNKPKNEYDDFRIKKLYLKNFRTFPFDNTIPYGLKFTDEYDMYNSVFLLGKNGIGKSSLFSALEYFYSGEIGSAKEIGIRDEENLNRFCKFGLGEFDINQEEPRLGIEYGNNEFKEYSLNEMGNISSSAIFCSEYDFKEINKYDGDWALYILSQLGYYNIHELVILLENIINERENYSINLKKIKDSQEDIILPDDMRLLISTFIEYCLQKKTEMIIIDDNKIDQVINEIKGNNSKLKVIDIIKHPFKEIWVQIIRNVKVLNNSDDKNIQLAAQKTIDENSERLKLLYRKLNSILGENAKPSNEEWILLTFAKLYNELDLAKEFTTNTLGENNFLLRSIEKIEENTTYLKTIRDLLLSQKNVIINEFKNEFNSFIVDILKEFSDKDENFIMHVTDNSCKLKVQLTKENKLYNIDAYEYFNTFRFKLFVVVFKIALAIKYMQKNKCIFPIILDDVFCANDFENRSKLESLIYYINNIYLDLIGFEYPLQLIIFTHDEKILYAFKKGFVKFKRIWFSKYLKKYNTIQKEHQYNYFIGRLIEYKNAYKLYDYIADKKNKELQFYNLYIKLN